MNDYKNCMDLNKNMVEGQIKPLGNISKQVMDAFLSIPRDQFVPLELKNFAYLEKNIELGNDRFLLKPSLIAKIISLADFNSSDTVILAFKYTTYMNAAALIPEYCKYFLQKQNIKHKVIEKIKTL